MLADRVRPLTRLLAPTRLAGFRWLWLAIALSVGGDYFSLIAVSWLTIQLSGSALLLGTVLAAQGIPRAGFILVGGALTDRFSARRLMSISALARSALMAAIALDTATGHVQLWHLFVYSVVFGTLSAFFIPGQGTLLPRLVPGELIEAGNAVINMGSQVARIAGPAAAGLVVAHFGPAASFAIDGACFFVCAMAMLQLRIPASVTTTTQNLVDSIRSGLVDARSDHALLAVIGIVIALNFAIAGPFGVGMVLIARQRLGGAGALGIVLAAGAAGSFVGTLGGGTLRPRRLGLVFILVSVYVGVITAVFSITTALPVAMGLFFLFGIGTGLVNVLSPSWIQRRTDPAMLGRVMALLNLGALGIVPLSMAAAGAVAQLGVTLLFVLSGALQVATAAVAASSRAFRRIS
jgi:predicted MFS family arabinose efflux permease